MKKIISFFLFAFVAIAAYSQPLFGVKGGLNMSTVTGNDIDNPKLHPSFHIGGFANFMIAEKIAIQPELLFSGKGSKSDLQGTYKLGYAQIPILVQYVDQSGFYAEVGPQAGL
ncbi:MAG: porin family protein, partial [Bacteroidota bacterium]